MKIAEREDSLGETYYAHQATDDDIESPEELALSSPSADLDLEDDDLALDDLDEDELIASASDDAAAIPDAEIDTDEDADLDNVSAEEVEKGLDFVIAEKLGTVDHPTPDDVSDDPTPETAPYVADLSAGFLDDDDDITVPPCGPDEFTCQGCFLVKRRVQLANPERQLCRDCYD